MKIGSYTWQKNVAVYDSNLLKYFHACVDGVLKKPKWWKQKHNTKRIRVTIEILENDASEPFNKKIEVDKK